MLASGGQVSGISNGAGGIFLNATAAAETAILSASGAGGTARLVANTGTAELLGETVDVAGGTGGTTVQTNDSTTATAAGDVNITSGGNTSTGSAGNVVITSGSTTGAVPAGNISLATGTSGGANPGNISLTTGAGPGAGITLDTSATTGGGPGITIDAGTLSPINMTGVATVINTASGVAAQFTAATTPSASFLLGDDGSGTGQLVYIDPATIGSATTLQEAYDASRSAADNPTISTDVTYPLRIEGTGSFLVDVDSNVDLVSDTSAQLRTNDAVNAGTINILSGNSTGGSGPQISIEAGDGSSSGGILQLESGSGTGTNAPGGLVQITSGNATGTGAGGDIDVTAGTSETGTGGSIDINAGGATTAGGFGGIVTIDTAPSSVGNTGLIALTTGSTSAVAAVSGDLTLGTGNSVGTVGTIRSTTGSNNGNGNGGDYEVITGTGTSGAGRGGNVSFELGDGGTSSGIGGSFSVTAGDGGGGSAAGGNVDITAGTGVGAGSSGSVSLSSPGNGSLTLSNSITSLSAPSGNNVLDSNNTELRIRSPQSGNIALLINDSTVTNLNWVLAWDGSQNVYVNPDTLGTQKTVEATISSSQNLLASLFAGEERTYPIDTTGGAVTVSLTFQEPPAGTIVRFKDIGGDAGTNNIEIDSSALGNIDGASSAFIATNYGALTLQSLGSGNGWIIV
jgi:hypothetical protein